MRSVLTLVAGVVVALVLAVGLGGADVGAQVEQLVIVDVVSEQRDITLTVVAPPSLRAAEIDSTSFLVTIGGTEIVPAIAPVPGEELDVVLLVDVSGSMSDEALAAAKASGAAFIRQLPANTRVAVVSFGDVPTVVQPFTAEFEPAIARLNELVAGGETALYSAVVEAARQFDPSTESVRSVVLLSDGGNTVAESSLGSAQAALILSNATLHAISIETSEANPAELDALADASGGSVARVEQVDAIEGLYRSIALDLGSQYRLSFSAPGEGQTEALIQARDNVAVVAETRMVLSLPVASVAQNSAPTPAPAAPPETRVAIQASAPAVVAIEASDSTMLKWGAIAAMSTAMAIIGFLVFAPRDKRRKVNRTEQFASASVITAAGSDRTIGWLVGALTRTADRFLTRKDIGAGLANLLDTAGWKIRNSEFVVLVGFTAVLAFFLGTISSFVLGIMMAFFVIFGVGLVLTLFVSRRRDAFNEQLNGTLQMMAGALRTGYSLPQVFALVAQEGEAPTSEEFSRVVVETRLGRDLVESTMGVASRMKNEDFGWATGAIEISRDVGGDLAEVLDNVASTIRVRARVRRQILALSAEGRISARILIALPFPIFFWQLIVSREYTLLLFTTSLGRTIMFSGVAALIFGAIWMRKLVQVKY